MWVWWLSEFSGFLSLCSLHGAFFEFGWFWAGESGFLGVILLIGS